MAGAKSIAKGYSLGLGYEIFARTGTVQSSENEVETTFEHSYDHNTGRSQTFSKSTHWQTIFIKDEEGTEHSVVLKNLTIPCRDGHKVTAFFAKSGGKKLGFYFMLRNHNTRDMDCNNGMIRSVMFPWITVVLLMVAYVVYMIKDEMGSQGSSLGEALIVTALGALFVGFILWLLGWLISFLRGIFVKNNSQFRQYIKEIST